MKCPILMYHEIDGKDRYSVSRATFERHMSILSSNGFRTVVPGEMPCLPPGERPVMITFDDGFLTDLTVALPSMERRGFRPVSFITVDYVGRPGYLARSDVKRLSDAGGSVQSHTCSHTLLTAIPPPMALREARESRIAIERATGKPVNSISFPGGSVNRTVCRLSREAGYRYLFTSRPSLGGGDVCGRVLMTEHMPEKTFNALISGDMKIYLRRTIAYDAKSLLREIIGPERYLYWWRRHLKYRGGIHP